MVDERQWKIALAKFEAFRENAPTYYREETVAQYHEIIAALEAASGESLEMFEIPAERMKPQIISARRGGYGGRPGSATYSKDKYCDPSFFSSQTDGLWRYLQSLNAQPSAPINRYTPPATGSHIHIEHMHGSSIQQGSPGATANITFQNNDARLIELLATIRRALDQLQLNVSATKELTAEVQTIQAQIASPRPKTSVITECLRSARTILESAATKAIASGLITEINKYVPS